MQSVILWLVAECRLLLLLMILVIFIYKWTRNKKPIVNSCRIQAISILPIARNLILHWMNRQKVRLSSKVHILQYMNALCVLHLKEKMFKLQYAGKSCVILFHPKVIQEIMKTTKEIDKGPLYDIMWLTLGNGLITSSGEKWRTRRKLLNPSFQLGLLENFQDIFYQHSAVLVEKFKNFQENETIEINELISLCSLEILLETVMGLRPNCKDEDYKSFLTSFRELMKDMTKWILNPLFWNKAIFYFTTLRKKMMRNHGIFQNFSQKVIKEKRENILRRLEKKQIEDEFHQEMSTSGVKKKSSLLDLLIYHNLDNVLSDEDIREEANTFLSAGHETSANTISWTLYLLGLHQDVQEKLFQEIQDILGDNVKGPITPEDLKNMKYLECVVKESLRLYPSVPAIMRKNFEEFKIGEYVVPSNSILVVYIYGIHHNPEVYKNPEIFDPERFSERSQECRESFSFIPFSLGPRSCIGQRFAMMMVKTVCANVIRHFKVYSLHPRDKILLSIAITLNSMNGIRLSFQKR